MSGLFEAELPSPREAVRGAQREQLLRAMLAVVAEKGFGTTTITEVVKRARVSTRTFYELFEDKEDCFLAAYELAISYVHGRIAAAGDAGLDAYLETLAAEPDLARVLLVEVMGAGRKAWERRDRALDERVSLLTRGTDRDVALALLGATDELARAHLREGTLPDLPGRREFLAGLF
jgi:AcrR family transcriptional regulator